jgi:hypothetical protein
MSSGTERRRSSWRLRLATVVMAPLVALLVAALVNTGAAAPHALAAKAPKPTPTTTPTTSPTPTPTPGGCTTSFVLASHPDTGGQFLDQFLGVAAVSVSDVWVVGADDASTPPGQLAPLHTTLIEHWNGTAWSIVPSPNSASGGYLAGVSALSSTNVWAVGSTDDASIGQTLIEHWDGASWSLVPSPNFSTTLNDQLTGVIAFSGTNAWAVGETQTLPYYHNSTLILHWDGASWTIDSSFSTGGGLFGISATSASDLWAVGGGYPQYTPLVLHNNGTGWSVVPAPGVQDDTDVLNGVDALTTSDVWAAGYDLNISYYTSDGSAVYNYAPFVEHWNGTGWSIVTSADPVAFDGTNGSTAILSGIGGADAADVWAAGGWSAVGGNHALIERDVCQ